MSIHTFIEWIEHQQLLHDQMMRDPKLLVLDFIISVVIVVCFIFYLKLRKDEEDH